MFINPNVSLFFRRKMLLVFLPSQRFAWSHARLFMGKTNEIKDSVASICTIFIERVIAIFRLVQKLLEEKKSIGKVE
jgi:hypothetical protein